MSNVALYRLYSLFMELDDEYVRVTVVPFPELIMRPQALSFLNTSEAVSCGRRVVINHNDTGRRLVDSHNARPNADRSKKSRKINTEYLIVNSSQTTLRLAPTPLLAPVLNGEHWLLV